MAAFNRRNLLFGSALIVTLVLVVWVNGQEEQGAGLELAKPPRAITQSVAKPVTRSAADIAGVVAAPLALDWQALDARQPVSEKPGADLFKSHTWYVPPPPKPAGPPPPPPKPVAPPAPFTYLGKMEDGPQGTQLMLSGNNKVYTVAVGESLDKTWRLDGEDANNVRFTYLPLSLPQTLSKSARAAGAKPTEIKNTENQGTTP